MLSRTLLCLLLSASAFSQSRVLSFPSANPDSLTSGTRLNLVQTTILDTTFALIDSMNKSPLENPSLALSKLDLKAPAKAQRAYAKGYQFYLRNDFAQATTHLVEATTIYPDFVAAHNALGFTYMGLKQNDRARDEFAKAAILDDHLPNSFLNLGIAELALKDYAAAETHIDRAASLAPLDLNVSTALTYSHYMNHNYQGAVTTAKGVHGRKHSQAAMVHFYAAAAWEAEGHPEESRDELNTFLKEDPGAPAAAQARQMIAELERELTRKPITITNSLMFEPTTVRIQVPQDDEGIAQKKAQIAKENQQLAEAEAACLNCAAPNPLSEEAPEATRADRERPESGYTFHSNTEEVALLFSAVDHGRSVTDLTTADVRLHDNHKAPVVITGFRNEDKLPLRLGLVIDSSASIQSRFKFEQAAAADFLKRVLTHPDDSGFVVGFANSILLVQDFTTDREAMIHGVQQLVPSGGTALWDAVSFSADKLQERAETQPVARMLVVISDGEDNSSSATAKQAIQRAQRGEVTVYTISTRELATMDDSSEVGEHALKMLAELTGGSAFQPGSIHYMGKSLRELEQVIRSRYLISYKPANFQRNGKYRAIDLSAQKNGKNLHVFARKGYVASEDGGGKPY